MSASFQRSPNLIPVQDVLRKDMRINIDDNETRFDADISNHGHFKCKNCGEIYDFELNENNLNLPTLNDYSIDEQHIYLKGICPTCLQ